jgi:heme-degrading monooxygenase HmoA
MSFAYIWEYRVGEDQIETFRRVYGPDGDWVRLFRRAEGYVRTELYQNVDEPARFITTDFWTSKTARDAFREQFRTEFGELDERCQALTIEERCLGDFDVISD